MYAQPYRLLQLTVQRQLTCTVRLSNIVQPAKSFHSAARCVRQPVILSKVKSDCLWLKNASPKYLSLSAISRNVSGATDGTQGQAADLFSDIPAPPPVPTHSESLTETITQSGLGETPFSELGLGGYTPSGLVQSCLEWLHVGLDLPWWGAIAIGVVTVRILMFPLVIKAQKNAAKLANTAPQMQAIQQKITQARQSGNQYLAAQYSNEMVQIMREKGVNPLKSLMVPLIQAPIFMGFFFGLKGMANAPVESMNCGGLFWFSDLTICDPFYILPLLTSTTIWAVMEMGVDSARLTMQQSPILVYVFRAMPILMFPFMISFPSAVTFYWLTTNLVSLVQAGFLRIPEVRAYFKIERIITAPSVGGVKKKGFRESLKEAWTNQKILAELNERQRLMETGFKKAGTGPIQKTYNFDPTKQSAQKIVLKGFKEAKKNP